MDEREGGTGDVPGRQADRPLCLTTVDPATLDRGPEPIRTLARHRKWDGATWFAVQLVPDVAGAIRLGDHVQPDR